MLDAAPTPPSGMYAHDVEYSERNLRMTETRIKELEERKRPLRDRLEDPDVELERAVELREELRADMADHRRRQRAT